MRLVLLLALALAGCLTDAPFRASSPAHEEASRSGFGIVGDASATGFAPPQGVTFRFVATNLREDAEALSDPCGDGNPRVVIEGSGGAPLVLQPPGVRCMAMASFQPFTRGAEVRADLAWNGTAYRDGEPYVAAPGRYDAVGTFVGRRDGETVEVEVRLPVTLAER